MIWKIVLTIVLTLHWANTASAQSLELRTATDLKWQSETCSSSMLHLQEREVLCAPFWRQEVTSPLATDKVINFRYADRFERASRLPFVSRLGRNSLVAFLPRYFAYWRQL